MSDYFILFIPSELLAQAALYHRKDVFGCMYFLLLYITPPQTNSLTMLRPCKTQYKNKKSYMATFITCYYLHQYIMHECITVKKQHETGKGLSISFALSITASPEKNSSDVGKAALMLPNYLGDDWPAEWVVASEQQQINNYKKMVVSKQSSDSVHS